MRRLVRLCAGLLCLALLAGCEAGPTSAQLIQGYDMALLELEANPNLDLREFETKYVWPFVPGSSSPAHLELQMAAARYVLGTEILRPSSPAMRQIRLRRLLYPFQPSQAHLVRYQRAIEHALEGRISIERAFQVVEEVYLYAASISQ